MSAEILSKCQLTCQQALTPKLTDTENDFALKPRPYSLRLSGHAIRPLSLHDVTRQGSDGFGFRGGNGEDAGEIGGRNV